MTEPVGCFIDYDTVQRISAAARRSQSYRVRPPDSGCLHPNVDPKDIGRRTFVDVACLDCGQEWTQVAVTTCPIGKKPIVVPK